MKKSKFGFLVAILVFQGVALGQSLKAEIGSIDSYCKTVVAITRKAKSPHLIFADTSDYMDQNSKPKWKKFKSEKALEKFRNQTETYSIAFSWRKGGNIVATNFTNFSPSGDWAMYIFHCYRLNGRLARVKSTLRTFYGDYIVTENRYFNGFGKQIRKTVNYQDLNTDKPKRPSSENDRYFTGEDIFKTTAKLPFAKLIKKK